MGFKVPAKLVGVFDAKSFDGQLLAFRVVAAGGSQPTRYGVKDGIIVDIIACEGEKVGQTLGGVLLTGGLYTQMSGSAIGDVVLGRLAKVDLGDGYMMWSVADPTPADVTAAEAVVAPF